MGEPQPDRNEYYRGEVFAMVGGRRTHGRVVANLTRHLVNHLEGSPCQVFSESMKVQIADDAILYPDVFVISAGQALEISRRAWLDRPQLRAQLFDVRVHARRV